MKTMFYAKLAMIGMIASVALFLVVTPGRASAAAPLGCGLLAPVNRADSDPNCLDENNAEGDGQYFTCTIADTYGSDSCESAGSSQATYKSNFVKNLQYYQNNGQPYQKISAAWMENELGGSNWAARIDSASVTLELTNYAFTENSEYVPTSNTSGYVYYPYAESDSAEAIVIKVNGVVYDVIKVDCGNLVGSARTLPPPDNPPTGSFVSLVCNAAAETYTIKVNYGDPDGATTAELRGVGGAVYETSGGTTATWTISTNTLKPGYFPVGLWVKDVGPSGTNAYVEVATHAIANCNPVGNIVTIGSCYQVSLKLWDPNDPNDNIKYDLSLNGAAKQGPYTFNGGQASGNITQAVNGLTGFNYWGQNAVTLYGIDNQTGGQVNLGTATITAVCGSVACGTSTMPGTLVAGEPVQFQVTMNVHSAAPVLPPNGPPGASFTSIKFDTLNTTEGYTDSGGVLYSNKVTYTPQTAGTYTVTWIFGGGESNPASVSCSAPNPTEVAYEQYFTTIGGDVSAGEGYLYNGTCDENKTAGITGDNLDSGASPRNYFGASSRQAAIATGTITGFASDATNNIAANSSSSTDGVAAHSPSGLAFGNTAPTGTTYGGGILGSSTQNWCVPDYASTVTGPSNPALPTTAYLNSLTSETTDYVFRVTGDLPNLGGLQLHPGVHITVIVAGNVYINGNIEYDNYTTLQDIPQFNLMTTGGGNIYIDPGVSILQGFYDAEPTATNTGGVIYTCASNTGGVFVPVKDYATCDTPLTIYGSVSSAQIVPGRTAGNVATTAAISDDPAEQIVYTPELWLGAMSGPTTSCATDPAQTSCMYQSYTSLPPVL